MMKSENSTGEESKALVLQGEPIEAVNEAKKACSALIKIVEARNGLIVNGKRFLDFNEWQLLARFFGASVKIDWTKPIERSGQVIGWEAKAIVIQKGQEISSAEAMCSRQERNWSNRDEYAIRSMAQTRAGSKALRNAFSFVPILAKSINLETTPAEEMPISDISDKPKPQEQGREEPPTEGEDCSDCNKPVSGKVASYSVEKYGKVLCMTCQKKQK